MTEVATGSYIEVMRSVGIKILKNRLSEYVRLASRGEVVLVTDRDQVVAELTPPNPARSRVLADALLAEGVRSGWVRPPALANAGTPERLPVAKFSVLMRELDRDRGDR